MYTIDHSLILLFRSLISDPFLFFRYISKVSVKSELQWLVSLLLPAVQSTVAWCILRLTVQDMCVYDYYVLLPYCLLASFFVLHLSNYYGWGPSFLLAHACLVYLIASLYLNILCLLVSNAFLVNNKLLALFIKVQPLCLCLAAVNLIVNIFRGQLLSYYD